MGWVLLGLFVLGGGAAAAVLVRRYPRLRRWWLLREGRINPRHPIVLLHGVAGFDQLPVAGAAYFKGLERVIEAHGLVVFRPKVPAFASVQRRADALATQLVELSHTTGHTRFNLVAHSMGGLDARYAIRHLGLAPHVASLITIGTPHRGTPLADLAAVPGAGGIIALLKRIGLDVEAFRDLSRERSRAFNQATLDDKTVFYGSVVGRTDHANPLLRPVHKLLSKSGPSDGLVPVDSQRWGEVLLEVDADHWGEIGWSKRGDPAMVLTHIARELRGRGL